jgi:hypothetical protein
MIMILTNILLATENSLLYSIFTGICFELAS